MRWLLLWLWEDLRALFDPRAHELSALRAGLQRARRRHHHHRTAAREASARVTELIQRIRALELSKDAVGSDLVAARRELVLAEGDIRHHRGRIHQAEEAIRLMKVDRDRLAAGEDARHRDAYAHLLDR